MKILGIDPGTTRTGYGVINKDRGLELVECGLIDGEKLGPHERLSLLEKEVRKITKAHKPDIVCVEKLFFTKNTKTASAVSEARGVILLALHREGGRVLEYTPSDIKAVVTGDGRADKQAVKKAVLMTLKIDSVPGPDDVSDALAIAIRGSFERGLESS